MPVGFIPTLSRCATSALKAVRRPSSGTSPGHRVGRKLAPAAVLAVAGTLAGSAVAPAMADSSDSRHCEDGLFCAWSDPQFRGGFHRLDARTTPMERCVALPAGFDASSFSNRSGRPVTVYQDPKCDTKAKFATYPSGSYAPHVSFEGRAVQIWTH